MASVMEMLTDIFSGLEVVRIPYASFVGGMLSLSNVFSFVQIVKYRKWIDKDTRTDGGKAKENDKVPVFAFYQKQAKSQVGLTGKRDMCGRPGCNPPFVGAVAFRFISNYFLFVAIVLVSVPSWFTHGCFFNVDFNPTTYSTAQIVAIVAAVVTVAIRIMCALFQSLPRRFLILHISAITPMDVLRAENETEEREAWIIATVNSLDKYSLEALAAATAADTAVAKARVSWYGAKVAMMKLRRQQLTDVRVKAHILAANSLVVKAEEKGVGAKVAAENAINVYKLATEVLEERDTDYKKRLGEGLWDAGLYLEKVSMVIQKIKPKESELINFLWDAQRYQAKTENAAVALENSRLVLRAAAGLFDGEDPPEELNDEQQKLLDEKFKAVEDLIEVWKRESNPGNEKTLADKQAREREKNELIKKLTTSSTPPVAQQIAKKEEGRPRTSTLEAQEIIRDAYLVAMGLPPKRTHPHSEHKHEQPSNERQDPYATPPTATKPAVVDPKTKKVTVDTEAKDIELTKSGKRKPREKNLEGVSAKKDDQPSAKPGEKASPAVGKKPKDPKKAAMKHEVLTTAALDLFALPNNTPETAKRSDIEDKKREVEMQDVPSKSLAKKRGSTLRESRNGDQ